MNDNTKPTLADVLDQWVEDMNVDDPAPDDEGE